MNVGMPVTNLQRMPYIGSVLDTPTSNGKSVEDRLKELGSLLKPKLISEEGKCVTFA